MTRLVIAAALVAMFGVFMTVLPAKTAPRTRITWEDTMNAEAGQPQTVQSAGVHALVGASFHAVHASF